MASVLLPGTVQRFLNQASKDGSSHDAELVLPLGFVHSPTPQNCTFCWESEQAGFTGSQGEVGKGLGLSWDVFWARFAREQEEVRDAGSCSWHWMGRRMEPAGCATAGLPRKAAWAAGSCPLAFASSPFHGCSLCAFARYELCAAPCSVHCRAKPQGVWPKAAWAHG